MYKMEIFTKWIGLRVVFEPTTSLSCPRAADCTPTAGVALFATDRSNTTPKLGRECACEKFRTQVGYKTPRPRC